MEGGIVSASQIKMVLKPSHLNLLTLVFFIVPLFDLTLCNTETCFYTNRSKDEGLCLCLKFLSELVGVKPTLQSTQLAAPPPSDTKAGLLVLHELCFSMHSLSLR